MKKYISISNQKHVEKSGWSTVISSTVLSKALGKWPPYHGVDGPKAFIMEIAGQYK